MDGSGVDAAPARITQPVLITLEVPGADRVRYVTPYVESLEGTFERTWLISRALVAEEETVPACPGPALRCGHAPPREPFIDHGAPRPLPPAGEFLAFRVVERDTGREAPCAECRAGEFKLLPGKAYQVHVVATSMAFLLPSYVDPARVRPIVVGPPGDARHLEGIFEGEYVRCMRRDPSSPSVCLRRRRYHLYQALTYASIDMRELRVRARTSPRGSGQGLLAASGAVHENAVVTSYAWSTEELHLPDPGREPGQLTGGSWRRAGPSPAPPRPGGSPGSP